MDRSDSTEASAQDLATSATVWPDGWYLFEEGQVRGPLNAEDAFGSNDIKDSKGKPRLISRKGFSQWYPVQDFAEIYRLSAEVGLEAAQEVQKLQQQLEDYKREPENAPSAPPTHQKVVQKTMEPMSLHKTSETIVSQAPSSMVQPISGYKSSVTAMDDPMESDFGTETGFDVSEHADVLRQQDNEGDPETLSFGTTAQSELHSVPQTKIEEVEDTQVKAPKKKAKAKAPTAKANKARSLMFHEYFLARGRMRLGKLRNPWMGALVSVPLTLGAYWVIWFHETLREVRNHLENKETANLPHFVLAAVPFFHIYMTYRLAKLVNQMETENKYSNTSPVTAAVFAVFPPLALIYLQDAINQHWWLHVKHEMMKKQKRGQLSL